MPHNEPHHIIAIGASAGAMEEIIIFFEQTPLDGVAYVIVQHLSPDFKSRMVELLAVHSQLTIIEATNTMEVQRNVVYLTPNNKFMAIREGRLYLTDKMLEPKPHLTINAFFKSLATDCGAKAIAVILSGLGSDGTEGVKLIKNEGGMVIARNPETAEFSSMPANAIASGAVDLILEPDDMPGAIMDFVNHGIDILPDNAAEENTVNNIIDIIKAQLPLDFSDYKKTTITRRIKRRAGYNKYIRLEDYMQFLKVTPEEVELLAKDFLISVTAFFRDKEAFAFVETQVLPQIIKGLIPGEELKMWVAGCATGEEAYSLAMLISEQLPEHLKDTTVKIFATDIDTVALQIAGKGIYAAEIAKDVSAERLEKHFIKDNDRYCIKPDIRKMVIFAQHDLVRNPPYCNMHFISCRNLLIYMTAILQKKIFLMLLFGLKKEGYLFLGSSESPLPILQNLEVIDKNFKIYRSLETRPLLRFDAFTLPELKITAASYERAALSKEAHATLADAINETLVTRLNYLVVCIDESGHVLKTYGDTTKYLLQKNFTTNLADLLPRPLAIAFNTLSINALKTDKDVAVTGIKVYGGDKLNYVNLSITPVKRKKGFQKLLLVTFSDDKQPTEEVQDNRFNEKVYFDEYTLNLEEELKQLRQTLHATYEKLDASNENMQSFNEELLSANEEMQSTNEEMQSINEELHTINADYQLKNKELLELNDDLNNYFRSNLNGQLVVNNDLVLMKYSPGIVKQINLLPSDIGRPLSNISTNLKFETISEDIKQVINYGMVVTREIETNNGKWYQLMTMPYVRQSDNKNVGAIMTFNDITDLKHAQQQLDKKNKSLQRINADLDNFVFVASHDLLAPLANIELTVSVMKEVTVNNPELNKMLPLLSSSVTRFRSLIKEIADIAKIESDSTALELVDINEILTDVEWALANKMNEAGAVIKTDLQVPVILFSKKNFRSIIYNLISNAIKFKGEQPPAITIRSAKDADNYILSVEDNGIGMDNASLNKIFAMYGRLQPHVEGQGIGLYLVKKIIDAAGGNITVESEPGKGTKFTISLVAAQQLVP